LPSPQKQCGGVRGLDRKKWAAEDLTSVSSPASIPCLPKTPAPLLPHALAQGHRRRAGREYSSASRVTNLSARE